MFHKPTFAFPLTCLCMGRGMMGGGCHSQFHHGGHDFHKEAADKMLKKISKELDLTKEQEAELVRIKDEVIAKVDSIKTSHKEAFDAVIEQVKSDSLDEEKLKGICDDRHAKIEELKPFFISKLAEFHALLTPEQRNKLADKMKGFHDEHHGW